MNEVKKSKFWEKIFAMDRNTHGARFFRDVDHRPMCEFSILNSAGLVVGKTITDYNAGEVRYFLSS